MSEFKKAQEATPTFTSGSMHEVQRQTSACKALNSYCSLSDKEIWQLFRQGNEAVFIYIYSTYFTNMYRFGSQFTRNRALIKDSIQDLFIELNEKRESINVVSSIKMYLFKSLKHKIRSLLIRKSSKSSLFRMI